MLSGFYSLTSGLLTQSRTLNNISNNMGNVSTTGFKKDTLVSTTFEETLMQRISNTRTTQGDDLGTFSPIRYVSDKVTNYTQGSFEETGRSLDFALNGDGFFTVQTEDGGVAYTRNGSFTIDDQGYLTSANIGRVMGQNGPILINTDKINCDSYGNLTTENGTAIATLSITSFTDTSLLVKEGEGAFVNANAANINANPQERTEVISKTIERSNVETMEEMVDMMESQRALQSSSQVLKMHDQLLEAMVTQIAKI